MSSDKKGSSKTNKKQENSKDSSIATFGNRDSKLDNPVVKLLSATQDRATKLATWMEEIYVYMAVKFPTYAEVFLTKAEPKFITDELVAGEQDLATRLKREVEANKRLLTDLEEDRASIRSKLVRRQLARQPTESEKSQPATPAPIQPYGTRSSSRTRAPVRPGAASETSSMVASIHGIDESEVFMSDDHVGEIAEQAPPVVPEVHADDVNDVRHMDRIDQMIQDIRESNRVHLEQIQALGMTRYLAEDEKQLRKRRMQYVNDAPIVFALLLQTLDKPLKGYITSLREFDPLRLRNDVLNLYLLIIHEVEEGPGSVRTDNKIDVVKSLFNIKQYPNEDDNTYFRRINRYRENIKLHNSFDPDEDCVVDLFIKGLDPARHSGLQLLIRQQIALHGKHQYSTLRHAYEAVLTTSIDPIMTRTSRSLVAAFAAKNQQEQPHKAGEGKPAKPEQKEAAEESAKTVKKKVDLSKIQCHHCQRFGHFKRNCPELSESAHAIVNSECAYVLRGGGDGRAVVLLDNQATASIINTESLVCNIRSSPPTHFVGIGGSMKVDKVADFHPFGQVWYNPDSPVNILSMSELIQKGLDVDYDKSSNSFSVCTGAEMFLFISSPRGLYTADFEYCQFTKEERLSSLPVKDIARAKSVRIIWESFGPLSINSLKAILSESKSEFNAKDVDNCVQLYGPHKGILAGRSTEPRNELERTSKEPSWKSQSLTVYADLMFVENHVFMLTRSAPIGLLCGVHLGEKSAKPKSSTSILSAISVIFSLLKAHGYSVGRLVFDGEGAVASIRNEVQSMGVRVDVKTGRHVPEAEAAIKIVKSFFRGVHATLPFVLPNAWIPHLVAHSIQRCNLLQTTAGIIGKPPIECLTGIPVNLEREAKFPFGQFVLSTTPNLKDKNRATKSRVEAGIVVGNHGREGALKVLSLKTGHVIIRNKVKPYPFSDSVSRDIQRIVSGAPVVVKETHRDDDNLDAVDSDPVLSNEAIAAPSDSKTQADQVTGSQFDVYDAMGTDVDDPPKINLSEEGNIFHVSVLKAIEQHGDLARNAVRKELQQMIDKQVFEPVHHDSLSAAEKDATVRSFMFMKDKISVETGEIQVKGRLVASGNTQDREIYESLFDSLSSPTASHNALLMVLAVSAERGDIIGVGDVPGAYLNAKMPDNNKVFMRLDKDVTSILCSMDSSIERFKKRDGSLTVRLKKALYGCIESAWLWYKEISNYIVSMGFSICESDPCVFLCKSKGTSIVLYVDDLLVCGKTQALVDEVFDGLSTKYGTLTRQFGPVFKFLGMEISFSEKVVSVSMTKFFEKMFLDYTPGRVYNTPCDEKIFLVDEDSLLLDKIDQDKYHSDVATYLYACKRVGMQCTACISFLASRVGKATQEDLKKLERLKGYLYGMEKTVKVGLKRTDKGQVLLEVYIDASHACHLRRESQAGCFATLGIGAIYAASSKQKIISKSSFEAEFVSFSDYLSVTIWLQRMLKDLGAGDIITKVYQDNKGTVAVLKSGNLKGKFTRHIDTRYFWCGQRISMHDIGVVWVPTKAMVADVLTKGLRSDQFQANCDIVCGLVPAPSVDLGE